MALSDEERRAVGRVRRTVFQNTANGIPDERIREAMRLSQTEIDQARAVVAKKITEYLFLRRRPPIACDTAREILWSRRELLGVLRKIGDLDLSSSLILKRITVQAFDHPEMIEGAKARMSEAYR